MSSREPFMPELVRETRPANRAEELLVDQLALAQAELARVAALRNHADAEETLTALEARATRNVHRAQKALARLQSARASHLLCRYLDGAAIPPAANLTRIPKPSPRPDLKVRGYQLPEAA